MSGSSACCTRPAAKAEYTAQGEWIEIDGLKIYRTGSPEASKAVVVVYDIFGPAPQTLQGADILAQVGSDKKDVQVFVPDFLEGQIAQGFWFSPDCPPDEVEKKNAFFSHIGSPARVVGITPKVVNGITAKYPAIKSVGSLGLCWGAKVVSLTAGPGSVFKAAAQAHPSFVDAKDAESIAIPIIVLASNEEPVEETKKFVDNVKTEKYFETFSDQHHGWMGARANLKDERNKAEYERGYGLIIDFFAKHL